MTKIEVDDLPHLESYNKMMDSEAPDITSRTPNQQNMYTSSTEFTNPTVYQGAVLPQLHPLLKVEGMMEDAFQVATIGIGEDHHLPICTTQVQLSDLELGPTWFSQQTYPTLTSSRTVSTADLSGWPVLPYSADIMTPPYLAYHYLDESDSRSPWSSSPEFPQCRPLLPIGEGEGEVGGNDKPYARLIYEALLQAPGHKMMLRDIYEWFRLNTTKPQESGSNGWQNSIRHNLSMNQAFENDREGCKGNARKANSVWMLTESALRNGVQSTTRYRKSAGGKRVASNRTAAIQRQRSGARGGRAARWAARQRRQENCLIPEVTSSGSPTTPSYSDISEYHSFNYSEHRSAAMSWPMTPVDDSLHLADDAMQSMCLSPQSSFDPNLPHPSDTDDGLHTQSILLRCLRDHHLQGPESSNTGQGHQNHGWGEPADRTPGARS